MKTDTIAPGRISKVVRVGVGPSGSVFCKIGFTNGKLSISGVEGPRGSCGQIDMHPWEIEKYAPGWNAELEAKFREVWGKWHLNDMRAGCEHQTGSEWEPKDITLYYFRLNEETNKAVKAAKARAYSSLSTGETFTPTDSEMDVCTLKDRITHHESKLPKDLAPFYAPNGPQYSGDHYNKASEVKKTNWTTQDEHPEGFLSKPCPVCGYKYGSEWKRQEVPQDVIEFLHSLPETDVQPAWV